MATDMAGLVRHYLQRDVEVQFDSLDKSGGFIGTMYYNKTENVALSLVKEGLATVHAYSAEGLSWSKHLFEAEVCRQCFKSGRLSLIPTNYAGGGAEVAEEREALRLTAATYGWLIRDLRYCRFGKTTLLTRRSSPQTNQRTVLPSRQTTWT